MLWALFDLSFLHEYSTFYSFIAKLHFAFEFLLFATKYTVFDRHLLESSYISSFHSSTATTLFPYDAKPGNQASLVRLTFKNTPYESEFIFDLQTRIQFSLPDKLELTNLTLDILFYRCRNCLRFNVTHFGQIESWNMTENCSGQQNSAQVGNHNTDASGWRPIPSACEDQYHLLLILPTNRDQLLPYARMRKI